MIRDARPVRPTAFMIPFKAIHNKEIHRRRLDLEEQAKTRRIRQKIERSCGGSHTVHSFPTFDDFFKQSHSQYVVPEM